MKFKRSNLEKEWDEAFPEYERTTREKIEYIVENFAWWAIILIALWLGLTNAIYSLSHPEKTQTEVFLHIPKSFICDFDLEEKE